MGPISFARYYEFDHYAPVVQSGAVTLAHREKDLPNLIRRALERPQKHSAQRRALLEQMFGTTLDGRSSNRIAETLIKLANK
jgi:hypothetical protein